MVQKLKQRLKNQRGMTLVELLAVIVILGIISAIAVPNITGLIDNTKKDAHVANAQQMVNAAKLAVTTNADLQSSDTYYLTLGYLEDQKFLDTVKDPDGDTTTYKDGDKALIKKTTLVDNNISYVKVENGVVTGVKLINGTRGVQNNDGSPVAPNQLKRGSVYPK